MKTGKFVCYKLPGNLVRWCLLDPMSGAALAKGMAVNKHRARKLAMKARGRMREGAR